MSQAMIVRHAAEANGLPVYTYTGESQMIDDGKGNWRIKFLTSGTFRSYKNERIDAFLVSGGGSGGFSTGFGRSAGGGGGGKTQTFSGITISGDLSHSITVGVGGEGLSSLSSRYGAAGGATVAFDVYASAFNGGDSNCDVPPLSIKGGSGGSGGGGGASGQNAAGGNGGSDGDRGSDGEKAPNDPQDVRGGDGQGTTTREFGEPTGDLYGGGGGGGTSGGESSASGAGGAGGGGAGGKPGARIPAEAGATNTGGGGGGGSSATPDGDDIAVSGGKGGSGIVIIRNAR